MSCSYQSRSLHPLHGILAALILLSYMAIPAIAMDRDASHLLDSTPYDNPMLMAPPVDYDLKNWDKSGELDIVGYWAHGLADGMATNGTDQLYIGSGRLLEIYDITTGASPGLTGSLILPGKIGVIVANESLLFVGTSKGFVRVDVSDPANPVQTEHYLDNIQVNAFWVDAEAVYVTASPNAVYKYSRNESALELVASCIVDDEPVGLIEKNGYLIVGLRAPSCVILFSDDLVESNEWAEVGYSSRFAVENDIIYVNTGIIGFAAFDISTDMTSPSLMSSCNPNYSASDIGSTVVLYGNYAYTTFSGGYLGIIDISDPLDLSALTTLALGGSLTSTAIIGSYLYIATGQTGLQTYDLADPTSPLLVDTQERHGFAVDLLFMDEYLLVAQWGAGIKTLDLTDPEQPVQVSSFLIDRGPMAFSHSGNTVFAINSQDPSFMSLDATDPTALALVDTLNMEYPSSIFIEGDIAYVAESQGLFLIDISDPSNLTRIGFLPDMESAASLKIGNYLYMCGDGGISIVDVSDPENPVIAGSYDDLQSQGLCYKSPYLFVATEDFGAVVLDL